MRMTDAEVFEEKYALYGDMLYRLAFLYLADTYDAGEDYRKCLLKFFILLPIFKMTNMKRHGLSV